MIHDNSFEKMLETLCCEGKNPTCLQSFLVISMQTSRSTSSVTSWQTFLVLSLHLVTVTGLQVSTGTIVQTFSLNGTLMSSQKGAGSNEHCSSCSSRGTFSTTHLCTSLHSFLTTLVHTFSSTCLLTLRITHRHFFTSSGAHTLVGVTLVTLLQTF